MEESSLTLPKRDEMLEKDSWSTAADGGYPASCDGDSVKETASKASDDSKPSDHRLESVDTNELCSTDAVLGESSAVNNNLYRYSPSHISQTESTLTFFNCEDKEGSDLCYEWHDIGNLEDVDETFRSCDSIFGLGSLSNDDDLAWFSPSPITDGSEDAFRSGFKLSYPDPTELRSTYENQRDSRPDGGDLSLHDAEARNGTVSCMGSQVTCTSEAASFNGLQFVNVLETKSKSKQDSMPKAEAMNLYKKLLECQHPSEGTREEICLEDSNFFRHYNLSEQTVEEKIPSGNQVHQVISSSNSTLHKHDGKSSLFTNMQMHNYITADCHRHVGQISDYPTLSSIDCENNSQLFPSPKESSYASNQVQYPHGRVEASSARNDGKMSFCSNHQADGISPTAISDPVAVLKRVYQTGNDAGGRREVGGDSIGVIKEPDPSLVQDSSCVNSMLDEVSLEATSFHQLQQVM